MYEKTLIQAAVMLLITGIAVYLMFLGLRWVINQVQQELAFVKWQESRDEPFRKKHGYGSDWVFVLEVQPELKPGKKWDKKVQKGKGKGKNDRLSHSQFLEKLAKGGLQTRMFFNLQRDKVFVKVRIPMERLKQFADDVNYQLQLNPVRLRTKLEAGYYEQEEPAEKNPKKWIWLPCKLPPEMDDAEKARSDIYDYTDFIYGKYDESPDLQDLYKGDDGEVFRNVDRLKLLTMLFENEEYGCGLNLREMLTDKQIVESFPLHDYHALTELKKEWLVLWGHPNSQPFDKIRDYYGEKLALYFVWLGEYTSWLISASIVGGFAYFIDSVMPATIKPPLAPLFAFFMAVWNTLFLEYWKRKQVRYSLEWGMADFEEEEQERIEFYGDKIPSVVSGKPETYFPPNKKRMLIARSQGIIFLFTLVVVAVVVCIVYTKVYFTSPPENMSEVDGLDDKDVDDELPNSTTFPNYVWMIGGFNWGTLVLAQVQALAIIIFGELFVGTARSLNDAENHRTETDYEDALIAKTFLFSFINSYTVLFFNAFITLFEVRLQLQCVNTSTGKIDCMTEVGNVLFSLFCTRLVVSNIVEVGKPALKEYKANLKARAADDGELSDESLTAVEEQFVKPKYDILHDLFQDYLEMVLQFGYATLFSAAFPLAPVLALVNNHVEIRIDAWKITSTQQRVYPKGAEDIGTWQSVMEIICVFAIMTNCALIVFTGNYLEFEYPEEKLFVAQCTVFFMCEHFLLIMKGVLMMVVDDVPEAVKIQLARTEFIVDRVIYQKEDDAMEIMEYTGTLPVKEESADVPRLNVVLGDNSYKRLSPPRIRGLDDDQDFNRDILRSTVGASSGSFGGLSGLKEEP